MPSALVTGCSSGIGFETALELGRRHYRVHAGLRSLDRAGHHLVKAARSEALDVVPVELDVTRDEAVSAAIGAILAEGRGLDVLVNNAGISGGGIVEECPDEIARRIFETNFFSVLRVQRAVLPVMRAQGHGAIVNVSSLSGVVPGPLLGIYGASKAALESMTEALYFEVYELGIRVALVEAGKYRTNIVDNALRVPPRAGSPYADLVTRVRATQDSSPGGDPAEVARGIAHAATSSEVRLRYIIGEHSAALLETRNRLSWPDWVARVRAEPGAR